MVELIQEEQREYKDAEYCHICKNVFGAKQKHRKVRDHDHYTAKYC